MPVAQSAFLPYRSYFYKRHSHENIRTLAKNTWCVDTIFIDSSIDCFINHVCMVVVSQVLQHVNSCIQHGNRVGNVLSCNCCSCVACAWFKYGVLWRKIKVTYKFYISGVKGALDSWQAQKITSKIDHSSTINPLKTKRRLLYLKIQSILHSKHFSSQL